MGRALVYSMYGHWLCEEFNPEEYFGFVYEIIDTTNDRKYIGKKQLQFTERRKVAGRKNRRVIKKDSNWRVYTGSNKELNDEISQKGNELFKFKILRLCKTKTELGYFECMYQFQENVLHRRLDSGEYAFYNSNIMNRWFRGKGWSDEKTNVL